jgi:uncharacterized damage-inducible protein DinB
MSKITPLFSIMNYYRETNADILNSVRDLTEEQIRWQPHAACHSIAFIVWHIARWEDHLQATIPGMTEELSRRLSPGQQIWERDQLAPAWGFDPTQLGESQTGTKFDIEAFGELVWPKKEVLFAYAQQVFKVVEHSLGYIDEEQFTETERLQYRDDEYMKANLAQTGTVGNAIMDHLVHNIHHLGELYYLIGLLKQRKNIP